MFLLILTIAGTAVTLAGVVLTLECLIATIGDRAVSSLPGNVDAVRLTLADANVRHETLRLVKQLLCLLFVCVTWPLVREEWAHHIVHHWAVIVRTLVVDIISLLMSVNSALDMRTRRRLLRGNYSTMVRHVLESAHARNEVTHHEQHANEHGPTDEPAPPAPPCP